MHYVFHMIAIAIYVYIKYRNTINIPIVDCSLYNYAHAVNQTRQTTMHDNGCYNDMQVVYVAIAII